MSNLRIGVVRDLVLPKFSDIKIGTFYKYQGLDGLRLKIDEYYFYDLERQMIGVENYHVSVSTYIPSFEVKRSTKMYQHTAIEHGDIGLFYGLYDVQHLAIKIANNEFFDLETNKIITLKNTDHEFEIPEDVCMNFYVNLDEITNVNRKCFSTKV